MKRGVILVILLVLLVLSINPISAQDTELCDGVHSCVVAPSGKIPFAVGVNRVVLGDQSDFIASCVGGRDTIVAARYGTFALNGGGFSGNTTPINNVGSFKRWRGNEVLSSIPSNFRQTHNIELTTARGHTIFMRVFTNAEQDGELVALYAADTSGHSAGEYLRAWSSFACSVWAVPYGTAQASLQ